MAHRSNQAVASQDRALPATDQPPPRRLLVGWATALAALSVSTAVVAFGVWLVRLPIAEFVLEAALSERGADADLQVVNLDFQHITIANMRVGAESAPDAFVGAVEAQWRWRGVSPTLERVRLLEPHLQLTLDDSGRISVGALGQIRSGAPASRGPRLPEIDLEIVDGLITIAAPFGALDATVRGDGILGRDFEATAQIEDTSQRAGEYALDAASVSLLVTSGEAALNAELNAGAQRLLWRSEHVDGMTLRATGRIPLDLTSVRSEATWRIASLDAADAHAEAVAGAAHLAATLHEDRLAVADWNADARVTAGSLAYRGANLHDARAAAQIESTNEGAHGNWTLAGQRLVSAAVVSGRPAASGRFFVSGAGDLRGDGLISLAQSSLSAEARQTLRDAIPALGGSPVGPTLASAERALDAAARQFTAAIPLSFAREDGAVRVSLMQSAEARSTSGARLRLSPLRQDMPALVLQQHQDADPTLYGAAALELGGGGAPESALLLDTVNWSPNAPLEAEGTLSLSNWSADGASIAADELGVSIALQPRGAGRIDLRGPLQITGPIGDGEVRELVTNVDIAATWSIHGWRLAPSAGCMPARFSSIEAAGLAFQDGAFALCASEGGLIAADSARNLSGGFSIQSVSLNGHMAGPDAQPAHLNANNIAGRFSGHAGDLTLSLQAAAPRLTITMAEGRILAIQLHRITADAHIAGDWRIDGAFEQGTLTDPALPGTVSTIAGAWSAEPEAGKPNIRVSAGEALLTANRPATNADRLLFNPLRLMGVEAHLQGGLLEANGAIVLEQTAQHLARFTAEHDVSAGIGGARINADSLTFGPGLKPYDITERARGLVDNVTGQASLVADINWSRSDIAGTGLMRLDGLSLATSTIPVVNDVRGTVVFDDIFALTTAPGQEVTVGLVNPGLAVGNGRVRFQLLTEQRVNIESAEFDFAAGVLEMTPTTITLGADETSFELRLRDVDAAALLASLNIPDLTATGRVEGEFPLLLTRRTALIQGGVLRAQGGGLITYTGHAGESATGPARIAFDALRSFNYDDLTITLNGDLNGEVISSIAFSGENSGAPVDLGPIAPIPGIGRVIVRGVPFEFNVTVTAPFRRLAQTAASFTDPGSLLERARGDQAEEQEETVDPAPPAPR